ncbi:hypothetical protein CSKR_200993, partial [Clonorchis sinensis]
PLSEATHFVFVHARESCNLYKNNWAEVDRFHREGADNYWKKGSCSTRCCHRRFSTRIQDTPRTIKNTQ